jgi:hypothetical protein
MSTFIIHVSVLRSETENLMIAIAAGPEDKDQPVIVAYSREGASLDSALDELQKMYTGFAMHVMLTEELDSISIVCGYPRALEQDPEVQELAKRITIISQEINPALPNGFVH